MVRVADLAERLPVAVDAMGGDNAPKDIVEGANTAAADFGVPVTLVGDPQQLDGLTDLPVIAASQVVEMGAEPATAVRTLKDSSVVRAAEAVRDGLASSMVSAGNTGAAMAASLLRLGRIKGIARPSIVVPFPSMGSSPKAFLDAGANSDCQPEWLVQFGVMGVAYARLQWQVESPRVGILTIGEEAGKGNALVKEASGLLSEYNWGGIGAHYVGNLEGRDLLHDSADVVVCDGFTGNIVLKSLEGAFDLFRSVSGPLANQGDLKPWFETYDPVRIGSGALLGVRGVSLVSHGSSSPMAICNAIRNADELSRKNLESDLRSVFLAK